MGVIVRYRYYHFSRCGTACTSQHLEMGTHRESPLLVGVGRDSSATYWSPGALSLGFVEATWQRGLGTTWAGGCRGGPCEGQRTCTALGHPPAKKQSSRLVWLRLRAMAIPDSPSPTTSRKARP